MSLHQVVYAAGLLSIVSGFPARTAAASKEFDFKDPKGVNSIVFVLDSLLEPIMGLANGVSGKLQFDPADPQSTRGTIALAASSVKCAHAGMTNVLHGDDWMNVKAYPTVEFTFKKIKDAKPGEDGSVAMTVVADLTLKGVTKELEVPVSATYLAGQLGQRVRGKDGDLLVLRSTFSVKRRDFGIKPEMGPETVAEEIELRVSIVGIRPE
jgi:polyisoprenoid-binding protein YceI